MADVVVIKLGGETLEGAALEAAAAGIADGAGLGYRLVVVHGAGPQTTAACKARGIEPRLVGGRRITDEATLAVLVEVLRDLSARLAGALRALGLDAQVQSGVVQASRRPPRIVSGAGPDPVDFGLVGDVTGFDQARIAAALDAGQIVVLPCLGHDRDGGALNINADIVSSQVAAALHARALLAVAGVGGVRRDKDDASTRLPRLTVAEARAAIADGTVQGGMIPKLEEAFAPLAAGVGAVHIVGPGEIGQALRQPGSVGTVLVP